MTKPVYGTQESDWGEDGLAQDVAVWEDGQRVETGPGFFEWWYFDAHLDDGSMVVITFMTKSIMKRKGNLEPGILVAVTRPDGTRISEARFSPPDSFRASKERCDVRIGENHVDGDLHVYRLHAQTETLAADLTFTGSVPAWRPGAGKARFGDKAHFFAWLPAIPFGSVNGTLRYDGVAHRVSGSGYHDHNWGNVSLPAVIDHWYWGRAHIGDFTLIFVEQITTGAYGGVRLPVFMLAKGEKILTGDGAPLTLAKRNWVKHPGGRKYPTELDFVWKKGDDYVRIALRKPEVVEATTLLNMFPLWKQKLFRLFANPYYFRFRADMDLQIDFGEIHTQEHGEALYELMLLR